MASYKNLPVQREAIIFSARRNGRAFSCLTARGGGLPKWNYCNEDLLWITLSTYKKNIESIIGENIFFKFSVGKTEFELDINLLTSYEVTPTLTVLTFTNFLAGEELIKINVAIAVLAIM